MPKVSVLVPTYNREKFLKLALESLAQQTSKDFEVVVLDNASVDETSACVESFADRLPNLRYVRQSANLGPILNIAAGLDFAEGEYIKFLFDDDLLEPDCIRIMAKCLDDYPEAALVTSKRTPIDENGNSLPDILPTRRATAYDALLTGRELIEGVLNLRLNFIGEPSTVMFRKSLVKEPFGTFSGLNFRVNADIALWFQLLTQGDAVYLVNPLSCFRLHPGQDQRQQDSEIIGSLEWVELVRAMRGQGYVQDEVAYKNVLSQNLPHLLRLLSCLTAGQGRWRTPLLNEIRWVKEEVQRSAARQVAKRVIVASDQGSTVIGPERMEVQLPRVLLIYPGLVEGFNSYNNGSNWFNHGVGMISAVLKKAGYPVSYLDCRKLKDWEEAQAAIKVTDFELALISVATVDFDPAQRLAQIIKEKDPGLKVMVGGPHPTLMTEETAEVEYFDYVFTHEAELTLPQVLKELDKSPRIIRGEIPSDLDQLPYVDRSLAPHGETTWFPEFPLPYFSITASRGCLYRCTFCQPAEREIFGNRVRKRSVDNILDELEYLAREYGMRSFMIHDDLFTQYYSWVEEFCRKKQERGLTQPFACQTRASIICKRPDLLKKLMDVGLKLVYIGFESGSDRMLQFIKKDTTVRENLEAGRICRELGIRIFANYMFGLPTETEEEMRETTLMIQAIKPYYYSPAVFTPAPGSELYMYCKEHDLILINSSEGYRRDANSGPKIKGVDYAYVAKMVALSKSNPDSQSSSPRVSLIIPAYNNLHLTIQCLEAVFQTLPASKIETEIIVVNNASTDGTKEYLEGLIPKINVVNIPSNSAFSGACNKGAEIAKGEYLVFLSNDTIVTGNWLAEILKPLLRDKSIGMVGCKLIYPNETIQHAGVGYTNVHGWLEPVHVYRGYPRYAPEVMNSKEMQAVTGACFAIRRELYLEIGRLDQGYINGLEDIDLCLKVKAAGFKVYYEPKAEVFHLEAQTPGRFEHALENIARFREKWEDKGIIQIDTESAEGVYVWK
ncbi:MAG: glycosyltransferase [Desulfitobacterium hafniense]|nr:glycosyltransferase [Desulfitobacterium hafniense]